MRTSLRHPRPQHGLISWIVCVLRTDPHPLWAIENIRQQIDMQPKKLGLAQDSPGSLDISSGESGLPVAGEIDVYCCNVRGPPQHARTVVVQLDHALEHTKMDTETWL